MNYYTRAFGNYFNFSGRDSRKQYWMFILINVVISLLLQMICGLILGQYIGGIITGLYSLVLLIPSLAILVRRLHDVNKSGFWYFIWLIPIIGWIWLLILLCKKGDETVNRFGPVPTEE